MTQATTFMGFNFMIKLTTFARRFAGRLLLCLCCLCFLLPSCSGEEGEENLFRYAIDTSDSRIAPRRAAFGTEDSAVLEELGLSEEDLEPVGENYNRLLNTVSIPGLSDEVTEIYSFYDGKLVALEYTVWIPVEEFDAACRKLAEQAEEAMPAELLRSVEIGIAEGNGTSWQDDAQNWAQMSFAQNVEEGRRNISLSIMAAK